MPMSAIIFETITGEDMDVGTQVVTKLNPAGGTQSGTQISLSTFGIGGAAGSATLYSQFASQIIGAGQSVLLTATYTGVALGDVILSSFLSSTLSGCILSAYVVSSGVVGFVIANPTTQSVAMPGGPTIGIKALALRLK